jgi:hypothetical protein
MGRESAPATKELCLRLAVLRRYVPTLGTLAAGVLWCYRDQQTALPLRFVLQLAAQLERAGIQDGTIQPRLLRHFLCSRSTHALDLQVFDYDNDVVFADVVRDFV